MPSKLTEKWHWISAMKTNGKVEMMKIIVITCFCMWNYSKMLTFIFNPCYYFKVPVSFFACRFSVFFPSLLVGFHECWSGLTSNNPFRLQKLSLCMVYWNPSCFGQTNRQFKTYPTHFSFIQPCENEYWCQSVLL